MEARLSRPTVVIPLPDSFQQRKKRIFVRCVAGVVVLSTMLSVMGFRRGG